MGASHGTTGWVCKAACHEADLVRRWSARRSLHCEIVGAVRRRSKNLCLKGLTPIQLETVLVCEQKGERLSWVRGLSSMSSHHM